MTAAALLEALGTCLTGKYPERSGHLLAELFRRLGVNVTVTPETVGLPGQRLCAVKHRPDGSQKPHSGRSNCPFECAGYSALTEVARAHGAADNSRRGWADKPTRLMGYCSL